MNILKKTSMLALFPLTAAMLAIGFTSCGSKTVDESAEFQTAKVSWSDSVKAMVSVATCEITVDYPESGNAQLVKGVRGWIAEMFKKDFEKADTALFDNGAGLVEKIGKHVLNASLKEVASIDSFNAKMSEPHPVQFNSIFTISNLCDAKKYVTFTNTNYIYTGGAHGGTFTLGQTFNAADGKRLEWENMFASESLPQLAQLVKEGLRTQYFKVETGEELQKALFVNAEQLPLPAVQPYFTAEGVNFIYQQYEIAPYSAGLPACVLPYKDVKSLMTPEAAALVD